jgi:hypothetical protein
VNRLYSDSAALFHDFFEIMGVIDPMLAFYYVLYIITSAILERNFTMESLRVKNIAPCAYKIRAPNDTLISSGESLLGSGYNRESEWKNRKKNEEV